MTMQSVSRSREANEGATYEHYLGLDAPVACTCDECGEPIRDGERYLCAAGVTLCELCADACWQTAEAEPMGDWEDDHD